MIDNQDNEIGKKNMTKKESLQLFEEKKVRTVWDDKEEKWYFSIVDVCGGLPQKHMMKRPKNYK